MFHATNLPTSLSQWKRYFDQTFNIIQELIPVVSFGQNKIEFILQNLYKFRSSYLDGHSAAISPREGSILFEFFKTCTAFVSFISQYTSDNILNYFLSHPVNYQYEELSKLWNSWSVQSSLLLIDSFTNVSKFNYVNYRDLKLIHKSISRLIKNVRISIPIEKLLKEKLDDIFILLSLTSLNLDQNSPGIIHHSDFEYIKEIGRGAFATVMLAKYLPTGQEIAVKELKQVQLSKRNVVTLKRELNILLRLKHPNILQFIGVTVTPPFCIETAYINNGSLFDRLRKESNLSPFEKQKIALCMARGLEYLDAMRFIHRDFKSQNVLLDKDCNAVICDFGISRQLGPKMTPEIGTAQWTAPEVLAPSQTNYDTSADTYSFAIVMWELATKKLPFYNMRQTQVAASVLLKGERPEFPKDDSVPTSMKRLIKQCWSQDPRQRPKMTQVRKSLQKCLACFKGLDDEEVTEKTSDVTDRTSEVTEKTSDVTSESRDHKRDSILINSTSLIEKSESKEKVAKEEEKPKGEPDKEDEKSDKEDAESKKDEPAKEPDQKDDEKEDEKSQKDDENSEKEKKDDEEKSEDDDDKKENGEEKDANEGKNDEDKKEENNEDKKEDVQENNAEAQKEEKSDSREERYQSSDDSREECYQADSDDEVYKKKKLAKEEKKRAKQLRRESNLEKQEAKKKAKLSRRKSSNLDKSESKQYSSQQSTPDKSESKQDPSLSILEKSESRQERKESNADSSIFEKSESRQERKESNADSSIFEKSESRQERKESNVEKSESRQERKESNAGNSDEENIQGVEMSSAKINYKEEFLKWVEETKEEHKRIMKLARDSAAREKALLLEKLHTLNPLDSSALKVIEQLYHIDYPLTLQRFEEILRLTNQTLSIPVQDAAFDLMRQILSRDDIEYVIDTTLIVDKLITMMDTQPLFVITAVKIIAGKIKNIDEMVEKFLHMTQSHVTLELIQALISKNKNKITNQLLIHIFTSLHGQFSIAFFRFMISMFGPQADFLQYACQTIVYLSLFIKKLAKLCETDVEYVKNMIGMDELKDEGRGALQQTLDMISVVFINPESEINEKMVSIIIQFVVAKCFEYQTQSPILPLLCICSRVESKREEISKMDVIWSLIMAGISASPLDKHETPNAGQTSAASTSSTANNKTKNKYISSFNFSNISNANIIAINHKSALLLIENIPLCQNENVRIEIWNKLVQTFIKTHDSYSAHAISSLLNRSSEFDYNDLIPTILEGVRNENDTMFCLTSLKLSQSLNADADKVLIDGNIFEFMCMQIPKKDNVVNKSIGKLLIKMVQTMDEEFPFTADLFATILLYLYDQETQLDAAKPFIVFLSNACKSQRILFFLQKRYFVKYIEQLPWRYENESEVADIIEYCVTSLTKFYPLSQENK